MVSKVIIALCCVMAVAYSQDDKYTDKYDNINVEEILGNKRLLKSYANCILDKGKCNAEGKELRGNIEDALGTGCKKCTEVQEKTVYTVVDYVIKNEPELWKELTAKYDPDSKYRKMYEDRARAKGIKIPE